MYKTPTFWKKKNLLSYFLLPFSGFYSFIYFLYYKFKKEIKIKTPVICVGNIVFGGAGKTPTTIKIRQLLSKNFSNIHVLTRGYLGQEKGPIIVSKKMSYKDVGDESIIHSTYGLTCVSKNKINGANFCEKRNADLIILDDGFQSVSVKKNFSILVIDFYNGLTNDFLFPAGPLRQSLKHSLEKCEAVLILTNKKSTKEIPINHKNIFIGYREVTIKNLKNRKAIAFCGLGNNENFLYSLEKLKIEVSEFISFPDHHNYSYNEIKKIVTIAKKEKLSVICTRKDFIKIPEDFRNLICVADLKIKIKNSKKLHSLIMKYLKKG